MSTRQELETFRNHITLALGPQTRIKRDEEGWPLVPGRYGRIEWEGAYRGAPERLYAFTDRRRMIPKLRAVPGVHPAQIGDDEARFWFRADDTAAIQGVAGLLRLKRRRVLTAEQALKLRTRGAQSHFQPQESTRPAEVTK